MIQKFTHKGYVSFLDMHDMVNLTPEFIAVLDKTEVTANIFKNPKASDNDIFLCDLKTHERGWGGAFRCFLYPDNKVLGSYQYLKEANLPDEKIHGDFDRSDENISIKAHVLQNGVPRYGVIFFLVKYND